MLWLLLLEGGAAPDAAVLGGTVWFNDQHVEQLGLDPSSFTGWWDAVGQGVASTGAPGRQGGTPTDRGSIAPSRRLVLLSVLRATTLTDRLAKLDAVALAMRGLIEIRVADDPDRVAFGTLETATPIFRAPSLTDAEILVTHEILCHDPAKYDRRYRIVVATGTTGALIPTGSLPHRGRLWIVDTLTARTIEVLDAYGEVTGQLRLTGTLASGEYVEVDMDRAAPTVTKVSSSGSVRTDAFSWLNALDSFPVFDPRDVPLIRHTGGGTVIALYRRAWSV